MSNKFSKDRSSQDNIDLIDKEPKMSFRLRLHQLGLSKGTICCTLRDIFNY